MESESDVRQFWVVLSYRALEIELASSRLPPAFYRCAQEPAAGQLLATLFASTDTIYVRPSTCCIGATKSAVGLLCSGAHIFADKCNHPWRGPHDRATPSSKQFGRRCYPSFPNSLLSHLARHPSTHQKQCTAAAWMEVLCGLGIQPCPSISHK